MKNLLTLVLLGSMASLSADYYSADSYPTCPNCPGGRGYQEGTYYDQGGSDQGAGYYQEGTAPRLVGTRPGKTGEGNGYVQMNQNNPAPSTMMMNRTATAPAAEKNNAASKYPQDSAATAEDRDLNAKIRERIKGGWFSKEYDTLILRTSNGIVVISGTVDTDEDAQKVHDQVKKVEGVRSVNNQIAVKKPAK